MNFAPQFNGTNNKQSPSSTADTLAISFSLKSRIDKPLPQYAGCGWHLPLETSPIDSRQEYETQGAKRKKRVPWSESEDDFLCTVVNDAGTSKPNWSKIAHEIKAAGGTTRSGKQCRERWFNHLRPHIKKGNWTCQEESMIRYYYDAFGPKWSCMAKVMKNRTDNDLKNKWNSMQRTEGRHVTTRSTPSKGCAALSDVCRESLECSSAFEAAICKPRALHKMASTAMAFQPNMAIKTRITHPPPPFLDINAVATDSVNAQKTARQVNWECRLQF